jgi:transcriptional regulator with PAS, ATPase and Fis domain
LCDRKIITTDDLPSYITNDSSSHLGFLNLKDDELHTMEEYEREIIKAAMKKYKSYNKVSKVLGLTHRTISLKCKKYGIEN